MRMKYRRPEPSEPERSDVEYPEQYCLPSDKINSSRLLDVR